MAVTRKTNKTKSYPQEKPLKRKVHKNSKRSRSRKNLVQAADLASDHDVRMLFDLKTPCDGWDFSLEPQVNLINADCFSDDLITLLSDEFTDSPIIGAISNPEDEAPLQVFNASLNTFTSGACVESSPESVFSENSHGAQSSECNLELSSDIYLGPDPTDEKYDDHTKDVINIMKLLSVELDKPSHEAPQMMFSDASVGNQTIQSHFENQLSCHGVGLGIYEQMPSYPQTSPYPFYDNVANFPVSPLMATQTALQIQGPNQNQNLVQSLFQFANREPNQNQFPILNQVQIQKQIPNINHFPVLKLIPIQHQVCFQVQVPYQSNAMGLYPTVPSPSISSCSGNIIEQYASPRCLCHICATSTIEIGLKKRKKSKPNVVKSQGLANVFEANPCNEGSRNGNLPPKEKKVPVIFPDEPGILKIIKPGSRRFRSKMVSEPIRRKSTYAFKPPSEYMIKAWNANSSVENRPKNSPYPETTIKNGVHSFGVENSDANSGRLSPLPMEVGLRNLPAGERWRRFKHKYALIDELKIQACRECYHCNRLFKDIECYIIHLDRHKIFHEFFCLDEKCPLAVIGFQSKWELRRHIRNDHLDQYAPYLATHMEDLVKDDLTKRMIDHVFLCTQNCCRKPFYRLDSLGRHVNDTHSETKEKQTKANPKKAKKQNQIFRLMPPKHLVIA